MLPSAPVVGRISVVVSPGARRTELVGRQGDAWKVRVAAAPERGRANDALCVLLAKLLGVTVASVRVVGGASARRKVVEVDGLDAAELDRRLSR
jgi:uncharacterized protein YggU (UPF0235/DUF167 family)